MKICFVASIRGKKIMLDEYQAVVQVLKSGGNSVYTDHVMSYNQEDLDAFEPDKKVQFHKKVIDLIKKSDIVVAEATSQSISVGYLISTALDLGKPTILLYKGDNEPNLLSTIQESDKLVVGKYKTLEELKTCLTKLLETASLKSDVRFNFFVSPKILAYLDWVAEKRMIPRSVFLRNLIEKEMKKDKGFRQ